jgi:sulfate transport system ATP-binding protein
MSIRIVDLRKRFKNFLALDNVSVNVQPGEFLALLGPSGSGKTTLLRVIAGLEIADSGQVFLEGESTTEKPPRERGVGFVFQHYALFRHMTVFENVAFGLRVKPRNQRPKNQVIRDRVMELLKLVHLEGLEGQYPTQLSGGQRQRVALARVLAVEPKVMLLDEPFGSLDAKVRKELRRWLRRLHDEMHITTILVTHDQEEAMEVADRVAIMNKGKIVQIGTPEEIWYHPTNSFVYDFMGNYNEFLAWRDDFGQVHLCDDEMLPKIEKELAKSKEPAGFLRRMWDKLEHFIFPVQVEESKSKSFVSVSHHRYLKLFVRPFEISLSRIRIPDTESISATIAHINPAGPLLKIELERVNGQLIQVEIPKESNEDLNFQKGETLWVSPNDYRVFEDESQKKEAAKEVEL